MRVQATSGAGVKFANPLKGGKIECYYKGVTSITGPPSGDLEKSVEDEHRKLATCDEEFSTGNYGVTTCPKTEYDLVVRVDGEAQRQRVTGGTTTLEVPVHPSAREDEWGFTVVDVHVTEPRIGEVGRLLRLRPGEERHLVLRHRWLEPVSGVVVDASGAPVVGAWVRPGPREGRNSLEPDEAGPLERTDAEGRFQAELAPVTIEGRKGPRTTERDEHPRVGATMEEMGKLPPAFKKGGVVTAGNASGICDGAAAVMLASAAAAEQHGLKPLAKLRGWHVAGVDPKIMGIGPVPAIKGALERAGLGLADMDLVEINEAFAAQYIACERALELDREKTNINGGAIALGHPLAASGARIVAHLAHELQRTGGTYAVGAACIGGGQGIAVVLERAS